MPQKNQLMSLFQKESDDEIYILCLKLKIGDSPLKYEVDGVQVDYRQPLEICS